MPATATPTTTPTTAGDRTALAIAVIVFTVLSLSFGDALVKKFGATFTLWQIFILRALFTVPPLALWLLWRIGWGALLPRRFGWGALRSLMLVSMWVAYYFSLQKLPLSAAAAVYYTIPIFITLFAALFIGDPVGVKGWSAVALGACGMLLILRPQAGDFNLYALLPLVAAMLYALAMILTRTKCRGESPLALALLLNLAFPLVGGAATLLSGWWSPPDGGHAFLGGEWAVMGAREWAVLAILALAILIGSIGAATAYQIGAPAKVATFELSYLAFAALWGALLFAESPDALTWAGMALIAAAGALAVRAGGR